MSVLAEITFLISSISTSLKGKVNWNSLRRCRSPFLNFYSLSVVHFFSSTMSSCNGLAPKNQKLESREKVNAGSTITSGKKKPRFEAGLWIDEAAREQRPGLQNKTQEAWSQFQKTTPRWKEGPDLKKLMKATDMFPLLSGMECPFEGKPQKREDDFSKIYDIPFSRSSGDLAQE